MEVEEESTIKWRQDRQLFHDAQDRSRGKFPKVRESVSGKGEQGSSYSSSISVRFRGRGWER